MASMVFAFGTRGSNGRALSATVRISIMRKASEIVSPAAPKIAAASSLMRWSMRARTTAFADISVSLLLRHLYMGHIVAHQGFRLSVRAA
jgi:hypothetical protein